MGWGFGYGLSLARVGIVLGPKIGYHFYSELVKIKQGVNENGSFLQKMYVFSYSTTALPV